MAVCKHCGAELPEHTEVCPNCGQQNTEFVDESYLDSLLHSIASQEPPERPSVPKKAKNIAKPAEEEPETEPKSETAAEREPDGSVQSAEEREPEVSGLSEEELTDYNIFDEFDSQDEQEIDRMISEELAPKNESWALRAGEAQEEHLSQEQEELWGALGADSLLQAQETPQEEVPDPEPELSEVWELPQEAPAESAAEVVFDPASDIFGEMPAAEDGTIPLETASHDEEALPQDVSFEELFSNLNLDGDLGGTSGQAEVPAPESAAASGTEESADNLSSEDILALDDLFQDIDGAAEALARASSEEDNGLSALIGEDVTEEDGKAKKKAKKGEQPSLMKKLFGNVKIDPSKQKPEPTPEELAAKKQAKAEEKKKTAAEKKAAKAEKKAAAKEEKEEKARQAELEKEAKKAKKLEKAKEILEEVEDTRINRVGAAIVFALFALLAVAIILGSKSASYTISVKGAEESFNKALNNDVKYYTQAYEQIYGLDLKEEDQQLGDKIMTVMFLNKQLNSYNSYLYLGDYTSGLDALLKGLRRYEKYCEFAINNGFIADMDYVRRQILLQLEDRYQVSEDEAAELNAILGDNGDYATGEAALEYTKRLYSIVEERCGGT